ncbi:hypothetical protein [Alistipes finegoldii]|uniref:hypothetical protein n=1 Tax=Alistipes finegoldii TaxID=214856 RepID=UPI003AEFE28A
MVDRVESYGIFVRIGKASGLVLAWGPVHDLGRTFKRGDSIRVKYSLWNRTRTSVKSP